MSDGVIDNPALKSSAGFAEIQQMALRIADMNDVCHPSGNEMFYESFVMLSENMAFLLVTVESDRLSSAAGT